jgi:hypothetical protein
MPTINPATFEITIPQTDLSFVGGTLYELDTDAFRQDMNALLESEDFIWMPDWAVRNAPVTVAGTTFSQTIEAIPPFSVTFENLNMSVRLVNSNNNLFDAESGVLINQPLVNVISQNSAGLIINQQQSLSPGDISAIALAVWNLAVIDWKATTIGGWITKKLLTVSKFLSLK